MDSTGELSSPAAGAIPLLSGGESGLAESSGKMGFNGACR